MARFEQSEVEAFFRREVSDVDSYLRIINAASDLPPLEALDAVQELLQHAESAEDVALVAACVLGPIVELHYKTVEPALRTAAETDPKMRAALLGVDSQHLPTALRTKLDGSK